jgi:hypothetical protein
MPLVDVMNAAGSMYIWNLGNYQNYDQLDWAFGGQRVIQFSLSLPLAGTTWSFVFPQQHLLQEYQWENVIFTNICFRQCGFW